MRHTIMSFPAVKRTSKQLVGSNRASICQHARDSGARRIEMTEKISFYHNMSRTSKRSSQNSQQRCKCLTFKSLQDTPYCTKGFIISSINSEVLAANWFDCSDLPLYLRRMRSFLSYFPLYTSYTRFRFKVLRIIF